MAIKVIKHAFRQQISPQVKYPPNILENSNNTSVHFKRNSSNTLNLKTRMITQPNMDQDRTKAKESWKRIRRQVRPRPFNKSRAFKYKMVLKNLHCVIHPLSSRHWKMKSACVRYLNSHARVVCMLILELTSFSTFLICFAIYRLFHIYGPCVMGHNVCA